MKTLTKNILAASCVALTATAQVACTKAEEQDAGSTGTVSVKGRAIDGPLAFANVFADLNENSKLDPFEPRTVTGGDGYFELPIPDAGYSDVLIRVIGGYDTTAGSAFKGELTRRMAVTSDGVSGNVTPISSLADAINVLKALGVDTENLDFDKDFLDDLDGTIQAINAHRMVTIVEDAVAEYKIAGQSLRDLAEDDDSGRSTRFGDDVNAALDMALKDGKAINQATMEEAVAEAICSVAASVEQSCAVTDQAVKDKAAAAATGIVNVRSLISALGDKVPTSKSANQSKAVAQAVVPKLSYLYQASEVILKKILAGRSADEIARAVARLQKDAVISGIQGQTNGTDIDRLVDNGFDVSVSDADIVAAAAIAADAVKLTENNLASNNLIGVISESEFEDGITETTKFALLFDVGTDQTDDEGKVSLCFNYKEEGNGVDDDDYLLLPGRFELVGNNTMLMTLTALGVERTATFRSVKDADDDTSIENANNIYRFNFENDFEDVTGPDAKALVGDFPTVSVGDGEDAFGCDEFFSQQAI